VKPEDCPELDRCHKVQMIMDKDLLDSQKAKAIRAVCATCLEFKENASRKSEKRVINARL
jgi:hypothetical protein